MCRTVKSTNKTLPVSAKQYRKSAPLSGFRLPFRRTRNENPTKDHKIRPVRPAMVEIGDIMNELIIGAQARSDAYALSKTPSKERCAGDSQECPRAPFLGRQIEFIDLRSPTFGPVPEKLIFPEL